MKRRLLAGLTPAEFMRRHWQKKPLYARAALQQYVGAFTRETLFELAARESIESRIVTRTRGRWRVRHGPFEARELARLPRSGWTLLVQGVDLALRRGARLLGEFAFLPYARLDDVMVSYAAPGGGVGPHFDSYDVFLVQTSGTRRWQVSAQRTRTLAEDAPLRVLTDFVAQREWTVTPGDVLYLPPEWAHDGVALTECITCSVGFRAPQREELATRFLDFLQDRLALEGRYVDPELKPTRRPGRIPRTLMDYSRDAVMKLRWSARDVEEFTGRYLSEPKPHVVFAKPARALSRAAFVRRASAQGLALAAASRMLLYGGHAFMNGESVELAARTMNALEPLAHTRTLEPPLSLDEEAWSSLYAWYSAGYIEIR